MTTVRPSKPDQPVPPFPWI